MSSPAQLCLARFPLTFTRNPPTPRNAYTVFTPSLYRVESVTRVPIVGWRKISISSFRKQNRCLQHALPSIVVHAFCWLYTSGQEPSIYDGKREKLNTICASRHEVPTGVQTDNSVEESSTWEANTPPLSPEIPHTLWNPTVHFRVHKSQTLVPTLN